LTIAGYDTVLAGKMHFIGPDQLHGFRKRLTTNVYPSDFSWVPVRGVEHASERSHALQYVGEAIQVGRWSEFLSGDEETHLRSLEYLHAKALERDEALNKGISPQPFFLCVSYHHPHEPFWPVKKFWDVYEGKQIDLPDLPEDLERTYSTLDRWLNVYHGISKARNLLQPDSIKRVRRAYYASISYVDLKVGELLDALEENGFADNTVVIFCSDHGEMLIERGMVQKRTFYEWSSRVPLITRFPKALHRGRRISEPVNLIDLMPTILDMIGFSDERRLDLDGSSLIDLINGNNSCE
jgi:choline-sulfatase